MASNEARVHTQQALAVYVEALAVGHRVAVFGDASHGLGPRIAQLGARSVCVWDPDAQRANREAEHATQGIIVRALPRSGPDDRGGAFDLAVVADLELFDDPEKLLAWVRGLVGEEGVALVAAPNRDGAAQSFDYYELFDLVAQHFGDVTMIAQIPFHGVALAELGAQGDDLPPVSVDTQLAGADRAPEAFVALASHRGVRLDPYAIVELDGPTPAMEVEDDDSARVLLAQARSRAEALEAEVEELRVRLAEADGLARATPKLNEMLRERSLRVMELENVVIERTLQVARISEEMESIQASGEAARIATTQLEALALRADRAERALAPCEADLVRLVDAHATEVACLEDVLRDRARALQVLEAELARREGMVRELVSVIEEAAHIGATTPISPTLPIPTVDPMVSPDRDALGEENAQLRDKLDALALELARRAGEEQASAWTIAELERRLESVSEFRPPNEASRQIEADGEDGPVDSGGAGAARAAGGSPSANTRLASALDELDVLRRALTQEHEARLRAESSGKSPAAPAEEQRPE
ncbi:MAG: hypothetical protein M3O46_21110 [Myxococcota bacterium]|nr:hypothetical protein [Myxococcota bacterium]